MRHVIAGLAFVGIIVCGSSPMAGTAQVKITSTTVAQSERPAIQAALERLLAAERSKDVAAIRALVTRGTLVEWERDVRDKVCRDLQDCIAGATQFGGMTTRVEITALSVDERARWALVYVKGLGLANSIDMFREDGAWKMDAPLSELVSKVVAYRMPPPSSAPILAPSMLAGADLPDGWELKFDEDATKSAGRRSFLSEMRAFELMRDGVGYGEIEYRLFTTIDYAEWYFWRALQTDGKAVMYDASGAPTKTLARAVSLFASTPNEATTRVRKGRIVADARVDLGYSITEYEDAAKDIGKRALRKLK